MHVRRYYKPCEPCHFPLTAKENNIEFQSVQHDSLLEMEPGLEYISTDCLIGPRHRLHTEICEIGKHLKEYSALKPSTDNQLQPANKCLQAVHFGVAT